MGLCSSFYRIHIEEKYFFVISLDLCFSTATGAVSIDSRNQIKKYIPDGLR